MSEPTDRKIATAQRQRLRHEPSQQRTGLPVGCCQHIAATVNVISVTAVLIMAVTVPAPGVACTGQEQADVNARDARGLKALERAVDQGDPADPPPVPAQAGNPTDRLPVRYHVWSNHAFKLIFEEACSVVDGNQKCGCGSLAEPAPNQ
jgi:hypothetical protein